MLNEFFAMFTDPMMQRSLLAALIVGICAPIVGTYLVQRKLSLLGDGVGHVALTGVALGWLCASTFGLIPEDSLAIPGAVVVAIAGAVFIELVRERGKTNGDVALALLFYGGIAGGVLLIGYAGGTNANLMSYLFGSISTVSTTDLWLITILSMIVITIGLALRTVLFMITHSEEYSRASGLPVRWLNIVIAVLAALTVTISMRVVGLLLVSAVMIVPVAISQLMFVSFRAIMLSSSILGALLCVSGLTITYWQPQSPGATIVVLAITLYVIISLVKPLVARLRYNKQTNLLFKGAKNDAEGD